MRAALYDRYGDADVVRVAEVREPSPGPGEVLVEVHAAALNPKDVLIRKGRYALVSGRRFPKRPGFDLAGVVRAVGPRVDAGLVGRRVLGFLDGFRALRGTLASLVALPRAHVAELPASLGCEGAAVLPLAGSTALQALRDAGALVAGEHVCIVGASGGVGTLAIQIAKRLGARVSAVASARSEGLVRTLGADTVFDRDRVDPFVGARYDLVLDAFGRTRLGHASAALGPEGRYVSLVPSAGLAKDLAWALVSRRRARAIVVRPRAGDLATLAGWAAEGMIAPVIDTVFGMDAIPDAMRRVETRACHGKVLVRVRECSGCHAP